METTAYAPELYSKLRRNTWAYSVPGTVGIPSRMSHFFSRCCELLCWKKQETINSPFFSNDALGKNESSRCRRFVFRILLLTISLGRFLCGSDFVRFDFFHYFCVHVRFFPIWFGLFSQSWTFYAREATESAVRFSEWIHLLSERYPALKFACPPAQFELLPINCQNRTEKKLRLLQIRN